MSRVLASGVKVSSGGKAIPVLSFRELTPEERERPGVIPSDLDQLPAGTTLLRFDEEMHFPRVAQGTLLQSPQWVRLDFAGHALGLCEQDVLRVWYSGLAEAGIIQGPGRPGSWRSRFIKLAKFTVEEGQGLLQAVAGKERLEGRHADLGVRGMDLMIQKTFDEVRNGLAGSSSTRPRSLLQDHLRVRLDQLGKTLEEVGARFRLHTKDLRPVGDDLLVVELTVDDLLTRQPLVWNASFSASR